MSLGRSLVASVLLGLMAAPHVVAVPTRTAARCHMRCCRLAAPHAPCSESEAAPSAGPEWASCPPSTPEGVGPLSRELGELAAATTLARPEADSAGAGEQPSRPADAVREPRVPPPRLRVC
jgi:hypothetical protein